MSLTVTFILPACIPQEEFEWNRPIHFLGPQKTLVVMVEFTDVRLRTSIQRLEGFVNIVNNFIKTSSYGKTWLDYYIYPRVIRLPKNMAYYGGPSPGSQRGDDPLRSIEFKYQTIKLFKESSGMDITQFTHVIIVHAGGDEAVSSSPNDIWSSCMMSKGIYFLIEKYGFEAIYEELGRSDLEYQMLRDTLMHRKPNGEAYLLAGVETVAEEDMPSIMIHEFTHSMWIYDLYAYSKDGYSAGSEVGVWTNMDSGPYLDPPVDIDGWSKYLLGWIEVVEVKVDGEYTINTLDKPVEPHGIIIPINDKEYYFIHARRPVGQDSALPGPGVLVFKVNKYRSRNIEGEPYMVRFFDANPETPVECNSFRKEAIRLCETLDAPYFDHEHYSGEWRDASGRKFVINLLTEDVATEEGYYMKVTEFEEEEGIAKIRVSLDGAETPAEATITKTITGEYTETAYTTVATYGTVTETVVVTVTVKPLPPSNNIMHYLSIIIITIAIISAFLIMIFRRKRLPPPPREW
ncbi:MAG: hypothetical protein QXF28_00350 [Nitrososphaerota archaeon]